MFRSFWVGFPYETIPFEVTHRQVGRYKLHCLEVPDVKWRKMRDTWKGKSRWYPASPYASTVVLLADEQGVWKNHRNKTHRPFRFHGSPFSEGEKESLGFGKDATLKTNRSTAKGPFQMEWIVFQASYFRGYNSFHRAILSIFGKKDTTWATFKT